MAKEAAAEEWFQRPAVQEGWNIRGGSSADRRRCIEYFRSHRTSASVKDMTRWFSDNPWTNALAPRKWRLKSIELLPTEGGARTSMATTAFSSAVKNATLLSKPTFIFHEGFVEEQITLPLLGQMPTCWVVCAYLSPTKRLLRVVKGFVSKEEESFPFAVATLRVFSSGCTRQEAEAAVATALSHSRLRAAAAADRAAEQQEGDGDPSDRHPGSRRLSRRGSSRRNGDIDWTCGASDCLGIVGGEAQFCYDLETPCRGHVRLLLEQASFECLREVSNGFWNARVPFKVRLTCLLTCV